MKTSAPTLIHRAENRKPLRLQTQRGRVGKQDWRPTALQALEQEHSITHSGTRTTVASTHVPQHATSTQGTLGSHPASTLQPCTNRPVRGIEGLTRLQNRNTAGYTMHSLTCSYAVHEVTDMLAIPWQQKLTGRASRQSKTLAAHAQAPKPCTLHSIDINSTACTCERRACGQNPAEPAPDTKPKPNRRADTTLSSPPSCEV